MTQPSLTTTFDTSLVDLSPPSSVPVPVSARGGVGVKEGSFSTIETEVSDDAQQQEAVGLGLRVSEVGGGDSGNATELESEDATSTTNNAAPALATATTSASKCPPPQKEALRTTPQKHQHIRQSSISSSLSSSPSSSSSSPNSRKRNVRQDGITKASAKSKNSVLHMPTEEAYDAWASTYDTDSNFLQAIDDAELQSLLPSLLARALACYERSSCSNSTANDSKSKTKHTSDLSMKSTKRKRDYHEQSKRSTLSIVDLGCGTGRNLVKMLMHPWPPNLHVRIVGLDFSNEMLKMARKKCEDLKTARRKVQKRSSKNYGKDADLKEDADVDIELCRWDFSAIDGASNPKTSPKHDDEGQLKPTTTTTGNTLSSKPTSPQIASKLSTSPILTTEAAHAVLSTLVAEHLPLPTFFRALRANVQIGGVALLTNMHPDMGQNAQAAFVDAHGNKVLSGKSWIHGIRETVNEAKKAGFEVLEVDGVAKGGKAEKQDDVDGDEVGGDGEYEPERVSGVREIAVEEDMVEWLGERSRKWIGTKVWFGMMLRRLS